MLDVSLPFSSFGTLKFEPLIHLFDFLVATDFSFSLALSFTQQLKVWFCKEGPAENLAKHLILKATKLPQYN